MHDRQSVSSVGQPPAHPPRAGDSDSIDSYAVRVGLHGQVGRFITSSEIFRRSASVVCRTARGLEVGVVLNRLTQTPALTPDSPGESASSHSNRNADGQIVRRMTAEDHLLWAHLQTLAEQARSACQDWLRTVSSPDHLLDVEPLLDGRTLYFHFLHQATPETDQYLEPLIAIYQTTVATSDFAHLLEHGCGPGCGTEAKSGGCGSTCQSCSVAKACAAPKKVRTRHRV